MSAGARARSGAADVSRFDQAYFSATTGFWPTGMLGRRDGSRRNNWVCSERLLKPERVWKNKKVYGGRDVFIRQEK